jgi:6-phosphofructokinase 1
MGNKAGWIALNAGVAVGAMASITMEQPFNLDQIVGKIKACQATGKKHFIILISEGVAAQINGGTEALTKEIAAKTGIDSRATILGHVQRGGNPSLRDRVVATEMGYYAVNLLDKGIGQRVVCEQNGVICDYEITEALQMKKPFDLNLYQIADEISL